MQSQYQNNNHYNHGRDYGISGTLCKATLSTSIFGFRRFPTQLSSNQRAAGETIANLNFSLPG